MGNYGCNSFPLHLRDEVSELDLDLFLRIAPELYLKRLIVEAKSSEQTILDFFNLDQLDELPMKEFDRALRAVRRAA